MFFTILAFSSAGLGIFFLTKAKILLGIGLILSAIPLGVCGEHLKAKKRKSKLKRLED